MAEKNSRNSRDKTGRLAQMFRNWTMAVLTLIFVFLYAASFSGKFDPLKKDNLMLLYLEPIIFAFIGYFFGQMPARQNERALKAEIIRQAQRADAAQYAKEKAFLERETLEEKIKNAAVALKTLGAIDAGSNDRTKREALKAVIDILQS